MQQPAALAYIPESKIAQTPCVMSGEIHPGGKKAAIGPIALRDPAQIVRPQERISDVV